MGVTLSPAWLPHGALLIGNRVLLIYVTNIQICFCLFWNYRLFSLFCTIIRWMIRFPTENEKEPMYQHNQFFGCFLSAERGKKPEFLCSLLNNKFMNIVFRFVPLSSEFSYQQITSPWHVATNLRISYLARNVVLVDGRFLQKHVQTAFILG